MSQQQREQAVFLKTYKRLPLEIEKGKGARLTAATGETYLDMISGVAVNALGHGHPAVLSAITEQAARYVHVSNYFLQEPQIALAELLVKYSGCEKVFFCNSGTEAVEGALKIARRWGSTRGKTELVSMSNAFHGRTMGALSLMDRPGYRDGFGPFLDGCGTAAFNDPASLRAAVGPRTAAVLLEFVQGEGGVRPVSAEFAAELQKLRAEHGFLIIADEIQSGAGRTGRFFAFEHYGVKPDLVLMAKPIGGGLPLGAILASGEAASVLAPGMHGTTFGGNPVACAAGIAVITEVMEKGVLQNVIAMGALLKARLEAIRAEFPALVSEVRGLGLLAGLELVSPGDPLITALREKKRVLLNCTDGKVIRFLPPLNVKAEELEEACAAVRELLAAGVLAGKDAVKA